MTAAPSSRRRSTRRPRGRGPGRLALSRACAGSRGRSSRRSNAARASSTPWSAAEVAERSQELERTLARLRADALSGYAEEERRIAEERRRDVAERERDATAKLGEQLLAAQRAVEQRLAEWASDVEKLQEGLTVEVKKLETKQRQLIADVEATDRPGGRSAARRRSTRSGRASPGCARSSPSSRTTCSQAASTELEQHSGERRRALQELADRMRRRERDLQEIIEREGNEAAQRIQMALGDVERRQVEALGRVVERAAARYSEAASQQFDAAIRTAREEAARRLGRELELAVERFAREAEGVLQERVSQVSDAAAARVEERLSRLLGTLERNRDDALASLEDRAHEVELGLRDAPERDRDRRRSRPRRARSAAAGARARELEELDHT